MVVKTNSLIAMAFMRLPLWVGRITPARVGHDMTSHVQLSLRRR